MFLVPDSAEDFFAVGEVSAVRAEDFESDGAVVADGLERADAMDGIDRTSAQWQMKVDAAAFVIVQMDVLETFSVSVEQFVRGVHVDKEVGVADVEVESEFWYRVH